MKSYYPMMVDLAGKRCVIVGGGTVAERKAAALIDAGALVVIISPAWTSKLGHLEEAGQITLVKREYRQGDLAGAWLVIAATDQEKVNLQVLQEAGESRQWVSAADHPDLSSFVSPAVMKRGKLQIAVSTSGASPSSAIAIKKQLEQDFGPEYEVYLDFLSEVRFKIRQRVKDTEGRQHFFKQLMSLDLLGMIRSGEFVSFQEKLMEQLDKDVHSLLQANWEERK